ncbi:MAG: hypothetical protein MZV65_35890 [Chromatiales bacterium]|nr:hypothetical protein [Chromatiales bacterium]
MFNPSRRTSTSPASRQDHQLLGDVSLAIAESRFHVTDACFAFSQQVKDGEAGRVHEGFIKFGFLFVNFHWFTYIQSFE